jgi:hypothetical protein
VQVLLQARPNGSTGWVRQTDVSLTGTDYRVTVELGAARVTLRRGDEVVFTAPAAVGTLAEPTPKGLCYVVALVPLPGGARGPFFFRLSAFSDAPNQQGDVGQIALAGTEDAASLGHANTRGAVLVSMDVLRRLGDLIPLGTPVEIVA